MKLAAQLYTVREYLKTDEQIAETLKKIKAIGYDIVQFSGMGVFNAPAIRQMLDENNMQVCVTHISEKRIIEDTDKLIAEHKLLDCQYIGLGAFVGKCFDDYKAFLDRLKPAIKKIHDSGLKFLYHNHDHEFIRYDGIKPLDYMLENTSPEEFGIIADLYWVHFSGTCVESFLKKYADRIEMVHLKDMRAKMGDRCQIAEVFEGNMDYDSICALCKKLGFKYAIVEQDTCDVDPFLSLKISYDNLKKHKIFVN